MTYWPMAWRVLPGAEVSWESQHRHAEQPLAVRVGKDWLKVVVTGSWVEGPEQAGAPLRWIFLVTTADGREFRVVRSSCGAEEVSIPGEPVPAEEAQRVH